MKYYSVKNGRTPGIYTSWEECREQVSGFSGAVYKSFATLDAAKAFITGEDAEKTGENCLCAYVDGSYNAKTGIFACGAVILGMDEVLTFSESYDDPEIAAMHNVAGEIKGAELVMSWCVEHNVPEIAIYHDYEGIAAWALGRWKTNKEGTRAYKAYYDSISDKLKVRFVKVKGHSGDKYNDMADELAKKAAGI